MREQLKIKETPLLMCGPMVRATLEDRKFQTRRVLKPDLAKLVEFMAGEFVDEQEEVWVSFVQDCWRRRDDGSPDYKYTGLLVQCPACPEDGAEEITCPYGVPGDRIWVKETFQVCAHCKTLNCAATCNERLNSPVCSGCDRALGNWKPSIFMRRAESRILLEVVAVRVERVQGISDEDAIAEGIEKQAMGWRDYGNSGGNFAPYPSYASLWDSLNGKRAGASWADNPWVWVITFKRVK